MDRKLYPLNSNPPDDWEQIAEDWGNNPFKIAIDLAAGPDYTGRVRVEFIEGEGFKYTAIKKEDFTGE